MLSLTDLTVSVDGRAVLAGVDLTIGAGEVHAVMGPNGSGKTTLARALMGDPHYDVDPASKINLEGKDFLSLSADERARAGLYVAWQNPLSIPGLSVFALCKAAYEARGKQIGSVVAFKKKVEELLTSVGLSSDHLKRGVNEGFSGGEKKRLELLQLLLLEPRIVILDEIDSGLDVDALRLVGSIVSGMARTGTAFLLITHYKRLLEYVHPTHVHILKKGSIVRSGGSELVEEIEKKGYATV